MEKLVLKGAVELVRLPDPVFYSQDVPMLRLERVDLSVQVLCFGLFLASQVFARVFGAPATRPHSLGIRLVG